MQRIDDVTTVVLAANPSPMTLEGTNTYLLGERGSGEAIVVDPGPDLPGHRAAVEAALAAIDAAPALVLLTHHHLDHSAAAGWGRQWGVDVGTFTPALVPDTPTLAVDDGEVIRRAGITLEVMHTPGHASDHVCLRVDDTGAVLTGDHILGRGTTVVAWPDGDMGAYLASLRRLGEVGATVLYPGHGPVVGSPARKVAEYIDHRLAREAEVLAALAAGDSTPAEVVARVYADVDPVLHPAAERSVRAHLDKLMSEGRVRSVADGYEPEGAGDR